MIALAIRKLSNSNQLDERGQLLGGKDFHTHKKRHMQEDTISFSSVNAIVSANDA